MTIRINLPISLACDISIDFARLDPQVQLAIAIEAYKEAKLTLGQFAELLGCSQYEADGILKRHGINLAISEEELAQERGVLRTLLKS
jgi:predicted HTH domain antitoxin